MDARPLPQAHRWAGLAGVAAVVLFAVANALWAFEQPAPGASAATVVGFYEGAADRIVAGGLLSLASMGIFVVFACAARQVLLDHGAGALLADLALAGTLLGLAAGLGAESVNVAAALRARDGELTEDLALALFDVSYVFGSYAVGIGFGVLALALSAAALWRSPSLLPRWLAFLGLAIAGALITPLAGWAIGEYTSAPPLVLVASLAIRLLRGAATPPV